MASRCPHHPGTRHTSDNLSGTPDS
jgi:hypothetical protein